MANEDDDHRSGRGPEPRTVHIVPHTHWDREWYRSFQSFRMRLVDLLDGLLPRLAADPSYAHFMLDGQMAVVDDYLAVRPDAAGTIRRLASTGRISVGPWYVLMDEFLVSGETMVRDLQLGLDRAAAFGGAMEVGYLPDMFGHVAQMPQLLAQFGFSHAVVWRGVPAAVEREAFRWEAPDGSAVRAEYLPVGYSNGAVVPDDAKELVARVDEFCADGGGLVGDPVLWMNGFDHLMPQPHLGRVVAEANAIQGDYHLEVTSLPAHLAAARSEGLPTWRGELRSGARANLLMGVASNRVDVHQAEARTTRSIERVAEPLSALWLPADRWPAAFLAEAWLEVVRNAAHDSICACSIDEVGAAVLHRFDEAQAVADGLTDRALRAVAHAAGGDRPVAVNPSARPRCATVELVLPGEDAPAGTQLLEATPPRRHLHTTTRAEAATVVVQEMVIDPSVHAAEVQEGPDGEITVVLLADADRPRPALVGGPRSELLALAEAGPPEGQVRVEKRTRPTVRVLARTGEVAGFGWRRWAPGPVADGPVRIDVDGALTNGVLTVEVDPDDGTWSIDGRPGFGRLVDDGDAGDTYNWCPPEGGAVVERPDAVTVEVLESGPVRGRVRVTAAFTWPEAVVDGYRAGARSVEVRTTLELRAGEDLLRVTHDLDNPCRDHRLRAWFPLPEPAAASRAECAFGITERGLVAEGGPTEVGLPTFPSRRFVSAGGLTVAHEGLLEYELVDVDATSDRPAARHLALTLLRCTGVISRGPMATRPVPAGPTIAAPAAQMPGRQQLRYALHVGGRDPYAVADDAFLPMLVARPRGGPADADEGSALTITGAEVSAVIRTDGRLTVRVFNPTDAPTTVTLEGRRGWLVDLRTRPIEPFEETFALRPHGIATAVLDI